MQEELHPLRDIKCKSLLRVFHEHSNSFYSVYNI